jgi:uncharacterized protein YjeT (DUF2065 family)
MNINILFLILGSIMVIEGLPYFLFPEKIKKFYKQIEISSAKILRLMGLIAIIIGLIIVYLVKSKICK